MLMLDTCCCGAIGFDEAAWSWAESCFSDKTIIENIKDDVPGLIGQCKILFAGNNSTCGNAIRFAGPDWEAIREWIADGGRLYIAAEHSGNYVGPGTESGMTFRCLQDMTNLNVFLATMGSAISYVGNDYNASSPSCSSTYYSPGAANIAQGINFTGERFAEVSGGTTLWLGTAGSGGTGSGIGKTAAAIERVGDGALVLIGDGNSGICSGYCPFLNRLYDYEIADVI
jgi:hypothetical protein